MCLPLGEPYKKTFLFPPPPPPPPLFVKKKKKKFFFWLVSLLRGAEKKNFFYPPPPYALTDLWEKIKISFFCIKVYVFEMRKTWNGWVCNKKYLVVKEKFWKCLIMHILAFQSIQSTFNLFTKIFLINTISRYFQNSCLGCCCSPGEWYPRKGSSASTAHRR